MPIRLDGRVAVVTGAGRGLGKAIAIELARMGAKVVVNDIGTSLTGEGSDQGPADEVVGIIDANDGEAVASHDDITDFEQASALIDTAVSQFGTIDILVNNAGTSVRGHVYDVDPEKFRSVIDVHLFGTFNCTRHAAPYMKDQGWGRIVNMVSRAGLWGAPGTVAYGSAKGAIFGFTNVVARDLAPFGITVNGINPAAMSTRMVLEAVERSRTAGQITPMQERMLQVVQPPEDVAVVAAYLCTEESKDINGQYFMVHGSQVGWFQPLTISKNAFKDGRWTPEELATAISKFEIPPLQDLY